MGDQKRSVRTDLLDTRPKRLHVVATGILASVVVAGLVRTSIVEREQDPTTVATIVVLMVLSLASSLFVMTSLAAVLPWRGREAAWWRQDAAYWLLSYSTAYVLVGTAMLLAVPVVALWKWVTAV